MFCVCPGIKEESGKVTGYNISGETDLCILRPWALPLCETSVRERVPAQATPRGGGGGARTRNCAPARRPVPRTFSRKSGSMPGQPALLGGLGAPALVLFGGRGRGSLCPTWGACPVGSNALYHRTDSKIGRLLWEMGVYGGLVGGL